MIYTNKIKDAIKFAIETHEINQKQKRKGKDIPYITHPLTVGLILATAGANEDVIVAGLLHDTIEDSMVTKEMIAEEFGQNVSDLVLSVTEQNKELSWEERKSEALEHIKTFSNDSVLLKSADLLSNTSEIISDYDKDGDEIFSRFNAPKDKILQNYLKTITVIIKRWSASPLVEDLQYIARRLQSIMKKKDTKKEVYTEWALKHYGGIEGNKRAKAFGDRIAQEMVDNLNRKVKEENPD